jgi:hypothetical protein
MSNKSHSDTQAKIERISYAPGVQDSGDLEITTRNINATGEPGSPAYSASLAIAAPADGRLKVVRLGVRLQVTIDSWSGGGTILNYRIKRAGVSIGTGTLEAGGVTGARYMGVDVTSGVLTGAATCEVYLWVNTGSCTISVCQLWVGVGTTSTEGSGMAVLAIDYKGFSTAYIRGARRGTGNSYLMVCTQDMGWANYVYANGTSTVDSRINLIILCNHEIRFCCSVSGDLVYLSDIYLILRSER